MCIDGLRSRNSVPPFSRSDRKRFIVGHAQTGSPRSAQMIVTALRSFLRFLRQRGAIATDLAGGVPGIANWRLSHLPKSLPPEQVERMLASCDRGTPVGERDYAILLLRARLGLRAGGLCHVAIQIKRRESSAASEFLMPRRRPQAMCSLPLRGLCGVSELR
jgi:site-specific recombinase XerC